MRKILVLTIVLFVFSAILPVHAVTPPIPMLISPTNGTTVTSRYVTFMWGPSAGAVKYELQYSTNSNFSSGYTTTINDIGTTSYTPTSALGNCQLYYWRVRASDGTYWSNYSNYSGNNWSFWVAESPPQPTLKSPEDAVQATSKRPTFTWEGSAGSTYILQIATNSSFTGATSWTTSNTSYQISSDLLEGTTYYWRVKATTSCAAENVSVHRTFTINLNNVLPKSPANGDSITDDTPTFEWYPVDNATKYKIQLTRDTDASFTTPLFTQETTLTSFTPTPILADGTYRWRVQAYRNSAWTNQWGQVFILIINTGTGLGEPAGLTPANGVTAAFPLNFTWGAVPNAYSYTIVYSKSESFASGNTEQTIFGNIYTISGTLVDGRWYWRVRANNNQGQSGPWSDTANFNVGLPVPVITSPESPQNGTTQTSTLVIFDWDDPISPPSGYTMQYFTLQYSTSNAFSPQSTIQVNTGLASRYPSTGTVMLADGTYYWHTKSTWKRDSDQTIHESGWSDAYSFTISTAPSGVPQLSSPLNGAVLNTSTPQLKWTTVSGPTITGYKIRYRKAVSSPGDPSTWTVGTYSEVVITGQATSSYTPPPLAENITTETYWWSVASVDNLGQLGQFAYPISFKIDVTPPDGSKISLISPVGVNVDSATPTYSWKVPLTTPAVYGDVASWTLEYASNVSFTENVKSLSPLTSVSATISGNDVIVSYTVPSTAPMSNGAYFWHVSATDAAGNKSQFSTIASFSVATTTPPQTKVTLISPTNGAQNVSTRPTFVWNPLTGTLTYSLQVSDSASDFTGTHLRITQTGLTASSYMATADLSTGTYYWRVNSTVANAVWSDISAFTVGTAPPSTTKVLLTTPTSGATNVSTTPSFAWQQLAGATSYSLLVSDNATDFSTTHLKVNRTGLTTTSWGTSADWSSNSPTTLPNGTYWWKVTSNVAGSDSDTWSFTIGAATTGNTVVITAQAACSTTALAGASVSLSSGTTNPTQTTDANGVATFQNVPNGTYNLTVSSTGYDNYTESVTISGQVTKTASLVTSGNGIITGVVYFDDVQHPAPNVTVRVYEQTSGNQAQTVVTNASGEFCALVPKSITYYLVVENYTDQKYEGVIPAATAVQKINIVVESKGSVLGVVADQDENIVQDARIVLRDSAGQFVDSRQSDNKGQFSFKVLPGTYSIEVTKTGYLKHTSPSFEVKFKQTYDMGMVRLTPDRGTLVINLTDKETGDPLPAGTITLQDISGRAITVDITNGIGSEELPAGSYSLTAASSGYEDSTMSVTVEGGKQGTVSISLGRAMGTITVTVTETVEGVAQPVSGADVEIDGQKAGATDDNGIFSLGGFEPGTSHSVKIRKEGYGTSDSKQAAPGAGEEVPLEFALKKSSPLLTWLLYGAVALVALAIIGFVGYRFVLKKKEVEVAEEEEARPEIRRPKPGEHKGGLPDKSYK